VLPIFFKTPDDLIGPLRVATVVFSVQIVADLVINSLEASLEGLQRVDLSRGVDIFRRTTVFAAAAVAALTTKELVPVALASMGATIVAAVVAAVVLWRKLPRFLTRPGREHHLGLLRYGSAVAALRPLGVLQRTMDRMIVGAILGPAAVTLVEIATQLQAAADAVLSATAYAVVPTSSWLQARKDRQAIGELAEQGTKYSLLVTLPVVLAIALLAAPTIDVWLGREYSEAAGLTAVAVANIALSAPLAVGSQMLLGLGKAGAILRAAVVAVTVNLLGSLLLVNAIGIVGVFQATLIGSLLLLPLLGRPFLTTVQVRLADFLRVAVRPSLLPLLVQAVVTVGVLALPLAPLPTVLVGGGAGLGAYALVAWRLSFRRGELADLAEIVRTRPPEAAPEA
jgi:O-antigen/teichoic acid export membrane protein